MGATNHHRTRGRKPRLGENRRNSSLREDEEPDEENGQTNLGVYIYLPNVSMAQNVLFSNITASRVCCWVYRPLTPDCGVQARCCICTLFDCGLLPPTYYIFREVD
ncbi:hypothetical protein TNCV_1627381 [Trichonephila clavipes]|nr:hypothetical protein TNCV_1627381 [Trichonephila clavipes]